MQQSVDQVITFTNNQAATLNDVVETYLGDYHDDYHQNEAGQPEVVWTAYRSHFEDVVDLYHILNPTTNYQCPCGMNFERRIME